MQVSVTPGINPCKADVTIKFAAQNQYHGTLEVPTPEMMKQMALMEIKQDLDGMGFLTATFGVLVGSNGPPLQYIIPVRLKKSLIERPG